MASPLSGNTKGWKIFSLFVLLAVLLGTCCMVTNPYLWVDDSGQFFISMGIDYWEAPFSPRGSWGETIRLHNKFLFDPFGYTVLLRIWQTVSTDSAWLRLFSFLGYVGMMGTGYTLLRHLSVPVAQALLLTALLASSPLLYQQSAELRPYSYEAWGSLYALLVMSQTTSKKSTRWALGAGLGMSFFLWMRYPFIIAAGIAGVWFMLQILKRPAPGRWRFLVAYALPQIASAALIAYYCIVRQPISTQMPVYGRANTLRYHPEFLFHPWTMFLHICLLGMLAFPVFLRLTGRRLDQKFRPLLFFTALMLGIWTLFGLLGKIANDPNARWAIGLNVTAMICLCVFIAGLLRQLPNHRLPIALVLLAVLTLFRPWKMTWHWANHDPTRFAGSKQVADIKSAALQTKDKIWVNPSFNRGVRYLFEHGALRSAQKAAGYPERFVLMQPDKAPMEALQILPHYQKVLWLEQPDFHIKGPHFKFIPWQGSPYVYWLWQVP